MDGFPNAKRPPRCQVIPLPGSQFSFVVAGRERTRWCFDSTSAPRPFFYPFVGPSGVSLTRMGHPGDWSHDHHRSVWFAHQDVLGLSFWQNTPTRIRQKRWLALEDRDDACGMAVSLGWFDGHEAELIEQEVIAWVRPGDGPSRIGDETLLEIQTTLRPTGPELTLGKTNFGLLAVRVAKTISAHFGGGLLTNSLGASGEAAVFGQKAAWVDYSGPATVDAIEGITYFDHPSNPNHPNRWHVRDDGWMGASLCFDGAISLTREAPLTLRYLLHAHGGPISSERAAAQFALFSAAPGWRVVDSKTPHQRWRIEPAA
ncbi:MAG TPA: PmoA family protein [Pirellulales bacterium]